MQNIIPTTPQVLRAKDASQYLGIGKSTFWAWVKQGKIPQGTRFGSRCTLWRVSDLDEYLNSIMAKEA